MSIKKMLNLSQFSEWRIGNIKYLEYFKKTYFYGDRISLFYLTKTGVIYNSQFKIEVI